MSLRPRRAVACRYRRGCVGSVPWVCHRADLYLAAGDRVLDAFHVVGFDAVDAVRRRVQQQTTGHRGRAGDPLFGIRRLLRRGHDHHSEHSWAADAGWARGRMARLGHAVGVVARPAHNLDVLCVADYAEGADRLGAQSSEPVFRQLCGTRSGGADLA